MTVGKWEELVEKRDADPHPCKYGHTNCSHREGGPCLDEWEQRLFEGDEDHWDN